jgi:acetoin utilization deacetylase AcuC-like enzyme
MLKIAWAPNFAHPLPDGHRFPMEKYDLLPKQLMYEGTIAASNLFTPSIMDESIITATHCSTYWHNLKTLNLTPREQRKTGFPHSAALIERESIIMQGTLDACHFALQYGIAMNIAGGTHHAFTNAGEGFCLLNDQAIAANYLLNNNLANKILIVDLDVHQGNGTAQIFENEPRVFTFSMHGASNYPMHKMQSDLDIALPDNTTDEFYLKKLHETLPALINQVQPDFMFYQCGVDVLATDKLGKLALTIEGCKTRDKIVLDTAHKNQIPLVCNMGGGYSEKLSDIITAHANTYRLAQHIFF